MKIKFLGLLFGILCLGFICFQNLDAVESVHRIENRSERAKKETPSEIPTYMTMGTFLVAAVWLKRRRARWT